MAGSEPAQTTPVPGEEDWVEPPPLSGGVPAGVATPTAAAKATPMRVLGRNLFGQQSVSPPSSVDQGDASDMAKAVVMLAEIQKQLMEKNQHQEANNANAVRRR